MTERLQILRIATDSYPEIMGGGAIHAHGMSKQQAEMGHEVTMLTSDHGDHEAPRIEERAGYTVHRYRELARPFGNSITPEMSSAIYRLAKNHDLVHAHSHLYFSSNVAAALARLAETPFFLTNHGLLSQTAPDLVQTAFLKTIGKFTFNSADRIFCYTDTDETRLRDLGVKAPISVIHNGIDCDTFTPSAGEEETLQILFVGRLKKAKGPHRLVEAFARLASDYPYAKLKLVGEGPFKDHLKELVANHGLSRRVEFVGHVQNENLPAIYAESTVFSLPSDAEGLPRTILESLACETPVVTSDLPQLESLVDGVGKTVPADSVEALEQELRAFLADSNYRRTLGERGRTKVVENYSWNETVQKTTEEYREVL